MEKICNFCARKDQAVVELERESIEDGLPILCIAEKHFWFTVSILFYIEVCPCTWTFLIMISERRAAIIQHMWFMSEQAAGVSPILLPSWAAVLCTIWSKRRQVGSWFVQNGTVWRCFFKTRNRAYRWRYSYRHKRRLRVKRYTRKW